MAESLVFLTEPDPEQRKRIHALLQRVPDVTICTFDTLALTRKAMRTRQPNLMIGPWAQGGETMIATRATVLGNAAIKAVPKLLLLTDRVSPARISMAKQAGDAELIPTDPLDFTGLYNRVMLLLCGADALYEAIEADRMKGFDTMLENLPALRKRLAA
jgi:hypothetical protein